MKNPESLATYNISQGHVIQLTASEDRAADPPQPQADAQTDPLAGLLGLGLDFPPTALLTRRTRRVHQRRELDNNDRLETI